MPTKIQGGLGIDKVQDGTVGLSDCDTELYGKITALTTINLGEAKTASGTFVDFVGIPEGVKRVTVMFDGVSTNGTSGIGVQIGSLEIQTSGYTSIFSVVANTNVTGSGTALSMLRSYSITAATTLVGQVMLNKVQDHVWSGVLNLGSLSEARTSFGMASVTLSGPLTILRITTVNGTDQFDAGTINISWEF